MRSKTALRRDPSKPQTGGGLTQSLQRLSPGVYRDAGGRLTNQGGRPLPQQPMRQPAPTDRVAGPAQYRPGTGMQNVAGSIQGQNPNMVNLPGQLPAGSNPYDAATAVAQYDQQQMNPSIQPWNYQPGTYRPWYLPPANSPWWSQPRQPAAPQQQQPQQPQIENKPGQPMSFEEFVRSQMGR